MIKFNPADESNKVIIFFEEYDGHILMQSEPQLVKTANFASFEKTYKDDYYEYARTLGKLATVETFSKDKFLKSYWISDWDVPSSINLTDLFKMATDLRFKPELADAEDKTMKVLDEAQDNLLFNFITYNQVMSRFSAVRMFDTDALKRIETSLDQMIKTETSKHREALVRHSILSQAVKSDHQGLVEQVFAIDPIKLLSPKDIQTMNNNFVKLSVLADEFVEKVKQFKETLETFKINATKIDWSETIKVLEDLVQESGKLSTLGTQMQEELQHPKAPLKKDWKAVHDIAEGIIVLTKGIATTK